MIARFLAGMVLGALVLVLLLAHFTVEAAACCKFERAPKPQPQSCWFFCAPRK